MSRVTRQIIRAREADKRQSPQVFRLSRTDAIENESATALASAKPGRSPPSAARDRELNGSGSCLPGWSAGRRPVRARRARSPCLSASFRVAAELPLPARSGERIKVRDTSNISLVRSRVCSLSGALSGCASDRSCSHWKRQNVSVRVRFNCTGGLVIGNPCTSVLTGGRERSAQEPHRARLAGAAIGGVSLRMMIDWERKRPLPVFRRPLAVALAVGRRVNRQD